MGVIQIVYPDFAEDSIVKRFRQEHGIIGESHAMQDLYRQIERAGPTKAPILIRGPSGTGKELIAHAIHRLYAEKKRIMGENYRGTPFFAVNSASIPDDLLESTLFGYVKGAFTGAGQSSPGRFELADGGILYFDEIGDLSLRHQAKVLRAIEDGEVSRLGSGLVKHVSVRMVTATNRDLERLIEQEKFREDLYYRISVIPLEAPPLSQREGDVKLLAEYFMQGFAKTYKKTKYITPDGYQFLEMQPWRGNVRELRNFLERAFVLCPHPVIDSEDLNEYAGQNLSHVMGSHTSTAILNDISNYHAAMARFEKYLLERALLKSNGNVSQAARLLENPRTSIIARINELGIDVGKYRTKRAASVSSQPYAKSANGDPPTAAHSIDDIAALPEPFAFKSASEVEVPAYTGDLIRSTYLQKIAPPLDLSSPLAKLSLHVIDVIITKARVNLYDGNLRKAANSLGLNNVQFRILQGSNHNTRITFPPDSFYSTASLDIIRNHIVREQLLLNENDKSRVAYLLGIKTDTVSNRANKAPRRADPAYI